MKRTFFLLAIFFIIIGKISALTQAPVDVRYMDLEYLSFALDNGILTSEQLVNIYLERIESYNKEFNAVTFINENAIKEAKELDIARNNGKTKGILHGIPIIVKTNIDVLDLPTTAGARALSKNMPKEDAEVVKKLRAAGAIIIASANMSEFAFSARDSVSSYGTVKNAYNPIYTSYGSSGGSAVAVALSFGAAALGTDTNSSLRAPASASYLVGFRPSLGSLSMKGIIPYDTTRDIVGPLTKTVNDSIILMSVMTGKDYTKNNNSDGLNGKRIGVATELYTGSNNASVTHNLKTYQPIIELMTNKLTKMKESGAILIDIDKLYTSHYFQIARDTLGGYTMCDGFNEYIKGSMGPITNYRELQNATGKIYSLGGYEWGCNKTNSIINNNSSKKKEYEEYISKIFTDNKLDAIVYPTTKNELFTLNNEGNPLNSPGTNITSVIGYTSVSVPLGFDSNNLPYGIEFLGKKNTEDILFEIISGYEAIDNKIIVSPLAPSLYDISDNVNLLVQNYQTLLNANKINNNIENLLLETKEYFYDYQDNENRNDDAKVLNTKYINIDDENIIGKLLDIKFILVILVLIICYFIFIVSKRNKLKRKILL